MHLPHFVADFVNPRPFQVTIGNYFKHLMYKDGRFAKHPRFRYFTLNMDMRWRALQAGRIYVRRHPRDAQLSVEELQDMLARDSAHQNSIFGRELAISCSQVQQFTVRNLQLLYHIPHTWKFTGTDTTLQL